MSYSFPNSDYGFKVRVNNVDRMFGTTQKRLEDALWCAIYLGMTDVIESLGNPSGDADICLVRWQLDLDGRGGSRTTETVVWETSVWALDELITDTLRKPVWTGRCDLPEISSEVRREVEEAWDPSF